MNQIWSPWRMNYSINQQHTAHCVFCKVLTEEDGPGNRIVFRGEHAFVILNRYPYTSGHTMIVPYLHAGALEVLTPPARAEILELANHAMQGLAATRVLPEALEDTYARIKARWNSVTTS